MIPRTRSSHELYIYPGDTGSSMKDWRAAISTPLTYRIGSSTVHFRSHLLLAGTLIAGAILLLLYTTKTGRARSNFVDVGQWGGGIYNNTYPLTPGVRVAQGNKFRIAVVADLDTDSKVGEEWVSYLHYGYLTISDRMDRVSVSWDKGEVELKGKLASGGRGMELSELQVYNGMLVTLDDRTGVVYSVLGGRVVPWVIMSDGAGGSSKGFKGEWCTVKGETLVVGGLGKEWTTSQGEVINHDPMYVKEISPDGGVKHVDWRERYTMVRQAAGISWPGYMIHEAVGWSQRRKEWVFLPRRMSGDRYNDVTDERMGTNVMITADEAFKDLRVVTVGDRIPTHGFSSFKFVPGTKETVIVALKSEEIEGKVSSYIMVFSIDGLVIYPETKIGDRKFEGVEFV